MSHHTAMGMWGIWGNTPGPNTQTTQITQLPQISQSASEDLRHAGITFRSGVSDGPNQRALLFSVER